MGKESDKGLSLELQIAAICQQKGWRISLPYQQACPYDLVIDKDDKLYKVQVKKSRACLNRSAADGWAFKMKCLHRKRCTRYNRREVDAFATIFNGQAYMYFLKDGENPPRSLTIKKADLPKYKL